MTLDEVLNQAVEDISILAIGRMSDTLHLDMMRLWQIGNQSCEGSGCDDNIVTGGKDQNRGDDVWQLVGGIKILHRRAAPFDSFHTDVTGNRNQKVLNFGGWCSRQHFANPKRAVIMVIQV